MWLTRKTLRHYSTACVSPWENIVFSPQRNLIIPVHDVVGIIWFDYNLNSGGFWLSSRFAIIIIIVYVSSTRYPRRTNCVARTDPLPPPQPPLLHGHRRDGTLSDTVIWCTSRIIIFYAHVVSYGQRANKSHYTAGLRIRFRGEREHNT